MTDEEIAQTAKVMTRNIIAEVQPALRAERERAWAAGAEAMREAILEALLGRNCYDAEYYTVDRCGAVTVKSWVKLLPWCLVVWLAKRKCERVYLHGQVVVSPFPGVTINVWNRRTP